MVSKKVRSKKAGGRATGTRKAARRAPTVTEAGAPSKSAAPPPKRVSVEVLLPAAEGGLSALSAEETISCSNIDAFRPHRASRDRAARVLSEMGFKVVAVSSHSLSVEATPALFTRTFGTQLDVRSIHRVQCGRPMRERAFYAPSDGATWEPPARLKGVIECAYVQSPAIYCESPLPPSVGYFHLEVPGNVAMLTGASAVHQQGITGAGVKVVMIDSGFFNHQYYKSHGLQAAVMLAPGALNPADDSNGHGTAQAANLFATAPGVRLVVVKQGLTDAAVAFKKAMDLGPDIIVCSWCFDLVDGSPGRRHLPAVPSKLKTLEMEIVSAVSKGICVVCAAGNGQVAFPGMHPAVISAGGVFFAPDREVHASNLASAFDSRPFPGRHVPDLCGFVGMGPTGVYIMLPTQPGSELDKANSARGAFPDGDVTAPGDGWAVTSGTSSAAPQIAGVCALLKQKRPSLTPQQMKQALMAGAADCSSGAANPDSNEGVAMRSGAGNDGATGHGVVNAAASVSLV